MIKIGGMIPFNILVATRSMGCQIRQVKAYPIRGLEEHIPHLVIHKPYSSDPSEMVGWVVSHYETGFRINKRAPTNTRKEALEDVSEWVKTVKQDYINMILNTMQEIINTEPFHADIP